MSEVPRGPGEKRLVLVVDDEPKIVKLIGVNLGASGYEVVTATDGRSALRRCQENGPDLVLLDIMLPDMSGFEVLKALRLVSSVPVIMVTAKNDPTDAVRGLQLGADDYVPKPFHIEELLARVAAVFRRIEPREDGAAAEPYDDGRLLIDWRARLVRWDGTAVDLTPTEYAVLLYLVRNRNRTLPHSEILTRVWGPEYAGETHYLRVVVARLRSKLNPGTERESRITTTARVGYGYRVPEGGGAR